MTAPVYGVTAAGFFRKPPSAIASSMTGNIQATLGAGVDCAVDQPLGQVIGIVANELSAGGWELGEVAYNATNRADVEGDLLDNVNGLTGTEREAQSPSTAPCVAQFSQAGTYAAGALAAYVPGTPGQQWTNKFPILVPGLANSIVGILPVPAIDPTSPGSAISATNPYTAANVVWQSTEDGPAYGEALVAAEGANLGEPQLTSIVPVTGWLNITDNTEVTIGTLEEEDTPYRVRGYQELSAPGSSTIDAVGAAILAALATVPIAGASVQMYENTTLAVDANGLPPKSFLAVVFDGATPDFAQDDPLIAGALWTNKPAGMQMTGSYGFTYVDSIGVQRQVYWTRPTGIPIYLTMTVAVPASMTSAQWTALQGTIAAALVTASQGQPFTLYGQTFVPGIGAPTTFVPGADVVAGALRSIVQGQTGVQDVPAASFFLGTSPSPGGTANLGFSVNQLATLAAGNITINRTTLAP